MYQIIKRKAKEAINKLGYFGSPDFLILGVEKGGTTGLFHTLSNHSKLIPAFRKEINYFSSDNLYGNHVYYNHFFELPYKLTNKLTFEGSHNYFTHPQALKRIEQFNPKMKFILSLRNPAYRMLSAWSMYSNKEHLSYDERTFKQVVSEELEKFEDGLPECEQMYLSRGLYYNHLLRALNVISREQILIIENTELLKSPKSTLCKIFDFIEVTHEAIEPEIHLKSKHKSKEEIYKSELSLLKSFYQKPNDQLFDLIDKRFEW